MVRSTQRPFSRSFSLFVRALLAGAAGVVLLLVALVAEAALTLNVSPIPIVITGGGTSTMVHLRNEGSRPLRLEASTYAWSQSASGEDSLTPTTELLVFPSLLTIEPGKTRKVRVGTQGGYGPQEKPFRVVFGELPANVSTPESAETVQVVARVSVPIFVQPAGATAALSIQGLTATKDRIRFQIRNVGGAHARIGKVELKFLGEGHAVLGSKELSGWYVLPGKTRPYDVPLGSELSCAGATRLVVTAVARTGATSATLSQPGCAG